MAIRDMASFRVDFWAMPIWSRIVVICCLAVSCSIGFMDFYWDAKIATWAPDIPVVATGQVYPVYVMRGSRKYVTAQVRDSLLFWNDKFARFVGAPVLLAFIILFVYRRR